jgi:hypothetical protein
VETRNSASKTSCEIDDRNQLKKRFISSQAFHRTPGGRIRKTTTGEQFKPIILESFDPVTQELYQHLPAIIHTRIETLEEVSEDLVAGGGPVLVCSCARDLSSLSRKIYAETSTWHSTKKIQRAEQTNNSTGALASKNKYKTCTRRTATRHTTTRG